MCVLAALVFFLVVLFFMLSFDCLCCCLFYCCFRSYKQTEQLDDATSKISSSANLTKWLHKHPFDKKPTRTANELIKGTGNQANESFCVYMRVLVCMCVCTRCVCVCSEGQTERERVVLVLLIVFCFFVATVVFFSSCCISGLLVGFLVVFW